MMSKIWKGLAQGKRKLRETLEKTEESVEKEGGIGKIVEDAAESLGEMAGRAAGNAARTVEGYFRYDPKGEGATEKPGLKDYREAGNVDVGKTADYGGKLVKGIVGGTTRSISSIVRRGKKYFDAQIADYDVTERDRLVKIGAISYRVERVDTKSEIGRVKDYMKDVSGKLPSGVAGRKDVLEFIAQNALTTNAGLYSLWKQMEKPEVKAMSYLDNKN
jgi:hypothetical protein